MAGVVDYAIPLRVNHGQLYPNLDDFVSVGYVEIDQIDDRTIAYLLNDVWWGSSPSPEKFIGNKTKIRTMTSIGYAKKELSDAEEAVEVGDFEAAKELVRRARADIRDFYNENDIPQDKFEDGVEQFFNEDSRDDLRSTLDRLQDFVDMMAERTD